METKSKRPLAFAFAIALFAVMSLRRTGSAQSGGEGGPQEVAASTGTIGSTGGATTGGTIAATTAGTTTGGAPSPTTGGDPGPSPARTPSPTPTAQPTPAPKPDEKKGGGGCCG